MFKSKFFVTCFLTLGLIFISQTALPQTINYPDAQSDHGFTLAENEAGKLTVNFSLTQFTIDDVQTEKGVRKIITAPGFILQNEEGAPNLPGNGRYLAIPQGANASLKVVDIREETYEGYDIAPAPIIPLDTDHGPAVFEEKESIYSNNAFYPQQAVQLGEPTTIRGMDAVMLGVTPFKYNPVTRELKVLRDIIIEVTFDGGNGQYGDDRLRSRWWDPLMQDMFLNHASIPEVDYSVMPDADATGCEYLIITPDDQVFQNWADTIRIWRTKQGIATDVVTLSDIGGNNVNTIENYIDNAYSSWDIVPSAVLLLGDYGNSINDRILSPVWNYYCASDNIYADVSGNDLPDIAFARITAQNAAQLELMINKFIGYESNPPVNPDYYNHPITAMGWQTERWFQLCSESINGFWEHALGKQPVRENNIYDGNPTGIWSTAPNTTALVNYFGPNGLGYIPSTPDHLTDWDADADRINNDINSGAFMLQHRDHGYEYGWGEPDYNVNDLVGLTNDELTFVFSVNCLTGKYNLSGESFAEAFHRHQKGALGLIAASEVSYSFVNDTYVWGLYDNMWPGFMPDYGADDPDNILPAFGNAAGKIFLEQSAWPYNTNNKTVTYHLFHHHGDAFSTVYTEIPQTLSIVHDNAIVAGADAFTITADTNSLIALSVGDQLIGLTEGTGMQQSISILPQTEGTTIDVVVTKQNYFRYQQSIQVINPNIAYVIQDNYVVNDAAGNDNGKMDYGESILLGVTMKNIGQLNATGVDVTLSTADTNVSITDATENFGDIGGNGSVTIDDAFSFDVEGTIPDQHPVIFDFTATDGTNSWVSSILINGHAPVLDLDFYVISDPDGNGNGRLDPGETLDIVFTIGNNGSTDAMNISGTLTCNEGFITINNPTMTFGDIPQGLVGQQSFEITVDDYAPEGELVTFGMQLAGDYGYEHNLEIEEPVGKFMALILDLDPETRSGPEIMNTMENMDLSVVYATEFPDDPGLYKNIFASLGLYYLNHVLTDTEGQLLADFLSEGGNLYMEGRKTWYDDPQTAVHDMFSLDAVSSDWYSYDSIFGCSGTFTNGMMFPYTGENAINYYTIEPEIPAFSILKTQGPGNYSSAVAYDDGDYKTIASTVEFGQLADGTSPSTKQDLMNLILDFFDGVMTGNNEINEKSLSTRIYPQPFDEVLHISLTAERNMLAVLEISGFNGQILSQKEIALQEGSNLIDWNGSDAKGNELPAGIYFYRLVSDGEVVTGKLIKK